MDAGGHTVQRDRALVLRFAAASLAAFLPIGLALSLLISHQLVRQAVETTKTQAGFVTNSILRPALTETDLTFLVPMNKPEDATFRRFVSAHVIHPPVALARIWRSDGTVIFSSNGGQIGEQYSLPPDLRAALRSYHTVI